MRPFPQRLIGFSARASLPGRWLGLLAALAALGWVCCPPLGSHVRAAAAAAPALPALRGVPLQVWEHFALNALLAPLLDAETPQSWTTPSIIQPCIGGSEVMLEDGPLPYTERVPSESFVLHWQLHDCWPLGENAMGLSGDLLLRIRPLDDGYAASIEPHGLVAAVDGQRYAVGRSFTGWLPVERAVHAE